MGLLKRLFGKKDSKKEPTQQPEKKTETKKTPEAKKADPESKQDKKNAPKEPARKYHVSLNKDEKSESYKMWRVRKEQSEKTIKHFKTQAEAIDYAEDLAEEADTSVVIHKKDGTIRKQDYKKKS